MWVPRNGSPMLIPTLALPAEFDHNAWLPMSATNPAQAAATHLPLMQPNATASGTSQQTARKPEQGCFARGRHLCVADTSYTEPIEYPHFSRAAACRAVFARTAVNTTLTCTQSLLPLAGTSLSVRDA